MTTAQHTATDPRPSYRDALSWVSGLVAGVRPDQLELATPCAEFDVRALLGHLVSVVRKVTASAEGTDPMTLPHVTTDVPDDAWVATYAADSATGVAAWSDDARLDRPLPAPWGRVPGREILLGYLNETLVHGWDLAAATGQDPEADPALAAFALQAIMRILPADGREQARFALPVEPAADAGPTERLANWSGRRTASWR